MQSVSIIIISATNTFAQSATKVRPANYCSKIPLKQIKLTSSDHYGHNSLDKILYKWHKLADEIWGENDGNLTPKDEVYAEQGRHAYIHMRKY